MASACYDACYEQMWAVAVIVADVGSCGPCYQRAHSLVWAWGGLTQHQGLLSHSHINRSPTLSNSINSP